MKKLVYFFIALLIMGIFLLNCQETMAPTENQDTKITTLAKKGDCATITSGSVLYSAVHYFANQPIPTGFDAYGYNYQAHLYKGNYVNVYLGGYGFPPYNGDDETYLVENPTVLTIPYLAYIWPWRMYEIEMKWNDAWLSNQDCYGDGKLDRHLGFSSYIGSGAWEMYSEKMGGPDGYTYKSKIIAVPADAYKNAGIWYNARGVEIGPDIWGQFAIIQEVQGGSGVEDHGLLYKGLDHTGLGGW